MSNQNANSATPLNVSCYEPNELLFKVPESLRKAFFLQFFTLLTWKSALNLPTVKFCRKAENFSLYVRHEFKLFENFKKFPRLFLCDSQYSSEVSNCSNGQKLLNSDTSAEWLGLKAWKISLTQIFFPHIPKDLRHVPKVIKEKNTFRKKFSKFSSG